MEKEIKMTLDFTLSQGTPLVLDHVETPLFTHPVDKN